MAAFVRSFAYAGKGFKRAVLEERNFRFHLCAAFYVFLFSFFYDFSRVEYSILVLLVAGVLSLELLNSALERTVAAPSSPKRYELAGAVKDMAAAAVMVFCAAAVVCGLFLFGRPAVILFIFHFFQTHLLLSVLCLLSLLFSVWFVFFFNPSKKQKKDN